MGYHGEYDTLGEYLLACRAIEARAFAVKLIADDYERDLERKRRDDAEYRAALAKMNHYRAALSKMSRFRGARFGGAPARETSSSHWQNVVIGSRSYQRKGGFVPDGPSTSDYIDYMTRR
jgi:hypothetical protein